VTLLFFASAAAHGFSIGFGSLAVPWAKSWLGNLWEFHNDNVLTPYCA